MRQFLILLLVMLQTAAPLVHAHVGHHADGLGLHLPTLESLTTSDNSRAQVTAWHHLDQLSQIVEVGSAIRLPNIDTAPMPAVIQQSWPAFTPLSPCVTLINFSPQQANVASPPPFLSSNISRAPPI